MAAITPTYATFGRSLKEHASQMMIVKSHAISVVRQPAIVLPNRPELWPLQDAVGASLQRAQASAKTFLASYIPAIDTTLAGVETILRQKQHVAQLLGPGPLSPQAAAKLKEVLGTVVAFRGAAVTTASGLGVVRQKLFDEAAEFGGLVTRLNGVVSGDQGVLRSLEDAIARIDREIAAAGRAQTATGLAALGGAFLFLVGAVASVFTGGAAAPVAILGGTLFLGGTVGAAASSGSVSGMLDEKNRLLKDHARLKAEVALVVGVSSTLKTLSDGAAGAASATQDMINAWTLLETSLRSLVANVEQGLNDNGALMAFFGTLAQDDIRSILESLAIIRRQLAGSRDVVDPSQPLARLVQQEAKRMAA